MSDITRIIAHCLRLNVDQVTPTLTMQEVDSWDSLSHMSLITQLEQHFSIQFTMDEIIQMTSSRKIEEIIGLRCQVAV